MFGCGDDGVGSVTAVSLRRFGFTTAREIQRTPGREGGGKSPKVRTACYCHACVLCVFCRQSSVAGREQETENPFTNGKHKTTIASSSDA